MVQRLEWAACDVHNCHCDIIESEDGDMVNYEDYAALEAKYLELAGRVLDAPCDRETEELAKEALGK